MGFFKNLIKSCISVTIELDDNVIVEVHNKKEAEFYAKQFLKHCKDSSNLVNHTKKPKVFFERYSLLIRETENLAKLELFLNFKGTLPSQNVIYLNQSKKQETNLMIERAYEDLQQKIDNLKTTSAKENTVNKLYKELELFNTEMTQKNIDLYNKYNSEFINQINKK